MALHCTSYTHSTSDQYSKMAKMAKNKSSSNNGGKPKRKHGVKYGKSGEKSSPSLRHLEWCGWEEDRDMVRH